MKLKSVIYTVIAIMVVYVLGNYYDLFRKIIWFDMPMHFAGGFAMGMLAISLASRARLSQNPKWAQVIYTVGFALIIGVLWEYYEFAIEQFTVEKFGWDRMMLRDTLNDLFFDSAGALISYTIFRKQIN